MDFFSQPLNRSVETFPFSFARGRHPVSELGLRGVRFIEGSHFEKGWLNIGTISYHDRRGAKTAAGQISLLGGGVFYFLWDGSGPLPFALDDNEPKTDFRSFAFVLTRLEEKNSAARDLSVASARLLLGLGHRPTLILSGPAEFQSLWSERLETEGFRVESLDNRLPAGTEPSGAGWEFQVSRQLELYLRNREFDVVLIPVGGGLPFSPLQSRRSGASLRGTAVVCVLDSLSSRDRRLAGVISASPYRNLRLEYGERYSVERAAALIAVDSELPRWVSEEGWTVGKFPLVSIEATEWVALLNDQAAIARTPLRSAPSTLPRVSVCVAHRNQCHYLRESLDSLAANDYPNFEVILVDDGSDEAEPALGDLERKYHQWRFFRRPWEGPGASRNAAARLADGEILIFFDADNIASPHLIRDLVEALLQSGLEAVGSCLCSFGDEPGAEHHDFYFLGPCLELAGYGNWMGDTAMAVHRQFFLDSGGFPQGEKSFFEDWEMLVRWTIAGVQWEIVPRILFWHRRTASSRSQVAPVGTGFQSVMELYENASPRLLVSMLRDLTVPLRMRLQAVEIENQALRERIVQTEVTTVENVRRADGNWFGRPIDLKHLSNIIRRLAGDCYRRVRTALE